MAFAKLKTLHTLASFQGGKKKPEWVALLKEHGIPSTRVLLDEYTFPHPQDAADSKYHAEYKVTNDIVRCLFHIDGAWHVMGELFDDYLAVRPKHGGNYIVVDVKKLPNNEFKMLGIVRGSCIAMSEAFFTATVPQLKAARKLLAA